MFNKEGNEKFEMRGQFTPENSALVLIDYQVGTLQLIRNVSSDVSLRNAVMLTKAAEKLGMPIVFTTSQEGLIQGPLAPALQHASPDAYKARVKRVGIVNAWADPKFSGAMEATGRKNLVMGGVTTDICLIFPSSALSSWDTPCRLSSMHPVLLMRFRKRCRAGAWSTLVSSSPLRTLRLPNWCRIGALQRAWSW